VGNPRCSHCGYQITTTDPGRVGLKYCSHRCAKRAQRRQPYTGTRNWTPTHPVDEPVVRYRCRNPECREPIYRRNQIYCSAACKQGPGAGITDGGPGGLPEIPAESPKFRRKVRNFGGLSKIPTDYGRKPFYLTRPRYLTPPLY